MSRAVSLITGPRTAWAVALVPFLLALVLIGAVGEGDRATRSTDSLPAGLDSTEAAELLDRLPEEGTTAAVVLFTADSGELTQEQLAALPQGESQGEGPSEGPGLLPAEDGTAALLVVPLPAGSATDVADQVEELRDRMDEAAPEGVTAQVTGPAAIQADLAAVFEGANTRLLLVTALVVAVLLVVTYRSPVLWLVPLAVVGVADRLAAILATRVLAALDVAWDESTVGILSVLVFGAGTNYALLLISRYRDELRVEESRHRAMARALGRTAEPVLASATTVVLGLLTLLLSLVPTTRGLGLACAVGIVVAASFVLVVLPATLVLFGRWIFWPKVPRVGDTVLVESGTSIWHRIGERVERHPTAIIGGVVVVLVALAAGVTRIDVGLDQADQFLETPEAISASERLAESFPAGVADPTQVVTTERPDEVVSTVESVDGVSSARVSGSGGGVTVIDAVLDGASGENEDTIEALRDELAPYDAHVTGSEAESIDEQAGAQRDLRLIVPLILVLVLGALVLLLRSAVAPVLLVLTVVATYAASLGVSWWLFTGPLGFESVDTSVPLFAFLFLVALGVDYNIFLVTRAREEAREHGAARGMLRALAATGGVITSAGILLAAVFAVLGVLPLVVLAQLGTVICIGVLLDTLVVRTLLVPALGVRLGDRFWWPRRVRDSAAHH